MSREWLSIKDLTPEDLLDAIGEIDDEKIKAAEEATQGHRTGHSKIVPYRRWSVIAACACAVLVVGVGMWETHWLTGNTVVKNETAQSDTAIYQMESEVTTEEAASEVAVSEEPEKNWLTVLEMKGGMKEEIATNETSASTETDAVIDNKEIFVIYEGEKYVLDDYELSEEEEICVAGQLYLEPTGQDGEDEGRYDVYVIKGQPDLIAIFRDDRFDVYRRSE